MRYKILCLLVQVAQYGLSHYSKNLSESNPREKMLEDGSGYTAKWQVPKGAFVKRHYDQSSQNNVLEFDSQGMLFPETFRLLTSLKT